MGNDAVGAAVEVLDGAERVARLCFSAKIPIVDEKYPNQVDPETGLIRLEEISHRQVKRGFSMQRIHLYSLRDAEALVVEREQRKRDQGKVAGYVLAGILVCKVELVHAIVLTNGIQVFQVLPKPFKGEPAHAEIHFYGEIKKEEFLEHRLSLQRALGTLVESRILDEAA